MAFTTYLSPDLSCNMREMPHEHVNKVKYMIFIGGVFKGFEACSQWVYEV